LFGTALNSHRASIGLAPVSDVRSYIFTDRPWLDPTLAPWPDPADQAVFQTGAWILPDERPLSRELETFLETGEPPVYFGFGSMRAPQDFSQVMIQTARALGRRTIVSRGWADLSLVDNEPDCLAIGEVNQQALFKRVAAVVHHGGAGTTTTAALVGAPQVVIPPRSTTSTTGHNEYTTSASEPRTHLAHQPSTRSRALSSTSSNPMWRVCPIHRHRNASRRRTGRRPALDKCGPQNSF
jgi:Erythromycin biosynthesis protein CIII-like, C-terminal domain